MHNRSSILSAPVLMLAMMFCLSASIRAQDIGKEGDTLHTGRFAAVVATESVIAAGSFVGLSELWYKDYPRSSFHFFDDNNEWLQTDKVAHSFTSYQLGRLGYSTLRWTGLNEKKSAWYGGTMGSAYLLVIEILDGFSKEWGFSWGDFLANSLGTSLFMGQQLGWHEQRIFLKYSYHPSKYAEYRPDLLGSGPLQRLIKDYNGITFWLSTSPGAYLKPETKFPKWIAFSVGYSAEGMLGGRVNPDEYNGSPLPDFDRNRRFFLSADIDFTRIPTRSKVLRTVFSVLNTIKVPFPALEINSKGKVKGHYFYF